MDTESGEKMDTETLKTLESDKMDTEAAATSSSDGGKMITESGTEDKDGAGMSKPKNKMFEKKIQYDWNENIQPHVKITVVGERGCGKSSLILAAKNEIFPHPDEKFVSKQYPLDVEVDGKTETCMVAEVKPGDKHLGSRVKIYSETDVVLLCFRENCAFEQVESKWVQELKPYSPDLPVLLVMIRRKLGNERLSSVLTELEGFSGPLECCPHQRKGAIEVFQEALRKTRGRVISEKK